MKTPILKTQDLSIGYPSWKGEPKVLNDHLNECLYEGEFVCLLGPNGAGKSTLIKTLSGLHDPIKGNVFFRNQSLKQLTQIQKASSIAIVLTDRIDIGPFSVWDIISLGRSPYASGLGKLEEKDQHIVNKVIESIGIEDLATRCFNELSDGEKQKVMIARALAQEPQLLFLDEPTAFLDLPGRVEIIQLLRKLTREMNMSVFMSVHDLDLAIRNADKIWLLTKNGGNYSGSPEDLVLNHSFEHVFKRKDIVFDPYQATFLIKRKAHAQAVVKGDSLAVHWTRHALEREGFEIVDYSSKVPLLIDVDSKNKDWLVTFNGNKSTYKSIAELIAWIRAVDR